MITAIVTIVMFLVMVSLHEFGHFITAKLLGIKVLEYAIGFGPAVWKNKKAETQYSLRAVPFGGYCKFEGEDEESEDERAFNNQPAWKRIIVIAAGGIFNIILGFVLFLFIIMQTSPMITNRVESVVPDSYIAEYGLKPGDEIVRINGKKVNFYNDITLYTQTFTEDTECDIVIKRDGKKEKLTFKPTKSKVVYEYTDDGVEVTDYINGKESGNELHPYSDSLPKDNSLIGKTETIERLIIGFVPAQENVTVFNIWGEAWNQTRFVVKLVYNSLWQMITGRIGVNQMSGPVGIVKEVNTAVNSGSTSWLYVLNLTALLTINLGVFNLLPVPALDGGRLFFILIELITRKKIPPEKEGMVHGIGFMLLMAFIIFVSFNDIMKLISG